MDPAIASQHSHQPGIEPELSLNSRLPGGKHPDKLPAYIAEPAQTYVQTAGSLLSHILSPYDIAAV
jgi:hypothetical protein